MVKSHCRKPDKRTGIKLLALSMRYMVVSVCSTKKEKEMDSELPSLKEVMEAFEDFMKKINEDMVKRYGLESDDE